MNANIDDATAPRMLQTAGTSFEHYADIHVHRLKLKDGLSVDKAIALLKALPGVRYAEPNYSVHMASVPNDASWASLWYANTTQQYAPHLIMADAAWNIWQPRQQVVVAVLDSGIDYTHPDLANVMYKDVNGKIIGTNTYGQSTAPNDDPNIDPGSTKDDNGHGTACAGILAAQTNNGTSYSANGTNYGIAGIAGWNGVTSSTSSYWIKLMPVKIQNASGHGFDSDIIAGLDFASKHGAKVISMSIYGPGSSSLNDATQMAFSKYGCVLVASAGNGQDNDGNPTTAKQYPGGYDNVISVAATDHADAFASYSNYGTWVSVAAPGGQNSANDDIWTTTPTYSVTLNGNSLFTQNYGRFTGTSAACPHVAGEAALLVCQNPSLTNVQVNGIIKAIYDPTYPFPGDQYSPPIPGESIAGGRVNVYRAVRAAGGAHATSDFNRDSTPDVLIWNASTGSVATWLLNASGINLSIGTNVTIAASNNLNWKVVGMGDMDNDGEADIVWQNGSTREIACWTMNGTALKTGVSLGYVADTNYRVVGLADINRDGSLDIVFQNSSTGAVSVWTFTGTSFLSASTLYQTYAANKLVGLADFNNDGYTDLLLRDTNTGKITCVLLAGTTVLSTQTLYAGGDNTYPVVAVSQGNSATVSHVNVFFQNATGSVKNWITSYANSTITVQEATTGTTGSSTVKVVGAADLNLGGQSDLLLQNSTTGAVTYWLLGDDNALLFSGTIWTGGDANWKLVSPRPY